MFKYILFAVKDFEMAQYHAAQVWNLARLSQARIKLLHIFPSPVTEVLQNHYYSAYNAEHEALKAKFAHLQAQLSTGDVEVDLEFATGEIDAVLIHYAHQADCDLLVLCHSRRPAWKRWWQQDLSRQVLPRIQRPVFLLPSIPLQQNPKQSRLSKAR